MKSRFIVLVLLSCLFMLFTSVSFANLSTSAFDQLKADLIELKDAGYLSQNFTTQYLSNGEYFRTDRYTILITSNYLYLFGCHANSSLITNYNVSPSNSKYNDWCQDDGTQYPYNCGCYRYTLSGTSGQSGIFTLNSETFVYAYTLTDISTRSLTLSAGEEYGGSVIVQSLPTFSVDNNGIINVYNNGESFNFYRMPFSRSVATYQLGTLNNLDSNLYHSIEAFWGPFYTSNIYSKSLGKFTIVNNGNGDLTISSENLTCVLSNGNVYVRTNNLLNNQGYALQIYVYDFNGNVIDVLGTFDFYAYSINNNISSGELINPDLDSSEYVEFMNQFEDRLGSSGDFSNFPGFNFYISGGIFSGDLLRDSGFVDYTNNNYSLFFYSIYRKVINALTDVTHSGNFSFTYRGHTYTFYASDFRVPDGPLKTFVSTFLIAGIVCLLIGQLNYIFITITTLDLFNLVRSFKRDHSLFM